MKPEYTSRCTYCGEPEVTMPLSCCGERHFAPEPECPMCGDHVDFVRHEVTGIETYVPQCQSCDWVGDPE